MANVALTMLAVAVTSLATLSARGFLSLLGSPAQSVDMAALFLLLGVGLDDTFVMMAAWQRAEGESLCQMLAAVYREAAVAITVTTATNVVAFGTGWAFFTLILIRIYLSYFFGTFLCVELFCLFTGVSLCFVYVFTLMIIGK